MKIAGGCFLVIVLVALLSLVNAWILMVLWGALASNFEFRTIGFGTAYLVCFTLGFVGNFFRSSRS